MLVLFTLLAQVFINLLSNAIRFTAPSPIRNITFGIEIRPDAPLDDSSIPPPSNDPADVSRLLPGAEVWVYGSVKDTVSNELFGYSNSVPTYSSSSFFRFIRDLVSTVAWTGHYARGVAHPQLICASIIRLDPLGTLQTVPEVPSSIASPSASASNNVQPI